MIFLTRQMLKSGLALGLPTLITKKSSLSMRPMKIHTIAFFPLDDFSLFHSKTLASDKIMKRFSTRVTRVHDELK